MTALFRGIILFVLVAGSWASNAGAAQTDSTKRWTPKQVKQLEATAATVDDHIALKNYFLGVAEKHQAEAVRHSAEAQAHRKHPSFLDSKSPLAPGTAAHCEHFAALERKAAENARKRAAKHEEMATEVR